VPEPTQVQESLTMMLGREVSVTDAGPTPPAGAVPVAVAGFVGETDALSCCTWVDLGLGAAIGAAVSMVDTEEAEACRRAGRLPADFAGNLREVLLVAGGLVAGGDTEGAPRLRDLELLEQGLADDTLGLLADPRQGGFYAVEVPEYGRGLLSFALV
jgi:hypothetical protein